MSNALTFTIIGSPGAITREVWTGIGGNFVSNIPVGAAPNLTDTLPSFEAPTNWGDSYGTRMRGYITAPVTGSYTFWIASDDNSELWLSSNDNPASKVRIGWVLDWTDSRQWNKFSSQKSSAIPLTAGQRYYVEALQKEGGGGDNLAVGWAKPGESTSAPSEVIPGSVLSPFNETAGPTPTLTTLSPSSAAAGGSAFTLTVNGSNFVSGSVVRWNGANRTTTFVSATQLTAAITAADIAAAGSASVTVQNNPPSGAVSNALTFTITGGSTPALTTLSPSSAAAGGSAFTLTVNGSNFVSGSVVRWNGANRTTTFVSATQLTAAITAADIAAAGSASVTVQNNPPSGAVSNALTFTITGGSTPALTTLSPSSAAAGGSAFTLTVNGSNFVSGSVVRWNGANRTTTFVSATQLTAAITAADIAAAGSASVTVQNNPPGGAVSNALTFTTTGGSTPALTTLSPSSAAAGGSAFTLTVNGSNFVSGSVVRWNGANRTTTFVSATQLTAAITAADIAAAGSASVTVQNNPPGGAVSNALTFTIIGSPGAITREVWTGIGGNFVSNIPVGAAPNLTDTLPSFEAPTNWADNYGTRMRGYITAPVTGSYTFWIASDNNSELWLSNNDNPASKVRIGWVLDWTDSRQWNKFSSQKSSAIPLTAGQRYYVEALQKEGEGGDNLAVGWAKPGESTSAPSEVIPSSVLSPFSGGSP